MKKTKWILTAALSLALSLCACAAEPTPTEPFSAQPDWVCNYSQQGSLTEQGYYYLENMSLLRYYDLAAGNSVTLCSATGCRHNSPDCEAYLFSSSKNVFFAGQHLYYLHDDGTLRRRSAIGTEEITVCTLAKDFREEENSVNILKITVSPNYLYYVADLTKTFQVEQQIGGETVLVDQALRYKEYLARVQLTTGQEEILSEQPIREDYQLQYMQLCAVRDDSVIFSVADGVPDEGDLEMITESSRSMKMRICRWDAATGETAVLVEKTRQELNEVLYVEDGKIYYCSMGEVGLLSSVYTYDLDTGKTEMAYPQTSVKPWGAGYAVVHHEENGELVGQLMNLRTDQMITYPEESFAALTAVGEQGVIVRRWIPWELDPSQIKEVAFCYLSYASMDDGVQVSDFKWIYSRENTELHPPGEDTDSPITTKPSGSGSQNELVQEKPFDFDPRQPTMLGQDEPLEYEMKIQYLPETVDNPDNLPVLKMVCIGDEFRSDYSDTAMKEINQMLSQRNMPFRLQLVVAGYEYLDGNPLAVDMLSFPEVQALLQDADIVNARMTAQLRQKYLSPITEFVTGSAQPSLANAVPDPIDWQITTVGEEIYGIPAFSGNSVSYGWRVNQAFMEKYDLRVEDFQKNYWEMDELFARLYAANGEKAFLHASNNPTAQSYQGGFYSNPEYFLGVPVQTVPDVMLMPGYLQPIGGIYAIDLRGEMKIVNIFEDEQVRAAHDATIRYKDARYTCYDESSVFFGVLSGTETYEDRGWYCIPVTQAALNSGEDGRCGYTTGIAAASALKQEAAQFLSLLSSDETFRNYLLYGKEGRDHTCDSSGWMSPLGSDGKPGCLLPYVTPLSKRYNLGKQTTAELIAAHQKDVESAQYAYCPVLLTFEDTETETAALCQVLGNYKKSFACSAEVTKEVGGKTVVVCYRMDNAHYELFLQELKAAGDDTIIASLQAQLDAWLAANPNWTASLSGK